MNGRVYDPELGRFLSADPTVQAPGNLQTLNRYSYAGNNPLSFVDPSGYSWFGRMWHKWGRTILAIAAMVVIPQMSWYFGQLANFMGGFVGGMIATGGDLKAGVIGGLTAGAFGMLHGMPQGGFMNGLSKVLAHGSVGGISSVLQGGKFRSGFMAAGFTQFASVNGAFDGFGNAAQTSVRMKNAIAAAIVGGTASVIGGGKFENGAVTGAFSRLFNDLPTVEGKHSINKVYAVADGKVMRAGWQDPNNPDFGLGFRVSIEDANGYYQYGHMDPDSLVVKVGDFVHQGDLIGSYADPTNGSSDGPHVHLERRLWTNTSMTVNPGAVSPLGAGGHVTAPWQGTDLMHRRPHQGVDWAY